MRHPAFALTLLAALLAASGAFAFEIQKAPSNPDGSAKFNGPDSTTGAMGPYLTGGSGGSTLFQSGSTSTSMSFSGWNGAANSTMSPALQQQFLMNSNTTR